MKKLGEKIKLLRFQKGMTQGELADLVGTTKGSISNYERDHRNPQYPVILAIADALEVPASELLECLDTDGSGDDIPVENQMDSRRPRRVKKLLAAFDRLSDDAQLTAIERIEELGQIPAYQRTLANVLQRYIFNRYQKTYELVSDTQLQEIYNEDSPFSSRCWLCNVRHITMQCKTEENWSQRWDFLYCQCAKDIDNDSAISKLLSDLDLPVGTNDDVSFVFDDDMILDSFYDRYADLKGLYGLGEPEWVSYSYQPIVLFFLVEKETWAIKDVQEYDPNI